MKASRNGRVEKPKSRQVHFWVDPRLCDQFRTAAKKLGEGVPNAYRQALKCYIDLAASDGHTFLFETTIYLGSDRLLIRAFTDGNNEILLRITGSPAEEFIALTNSFRPHDLLAAVARSITTDGDRPSGNQLGHGRRDQVTVRKARG